MLYNVYDKNYYGLPKLYTIYTFEKFFLWRIIIQYYVHYLNYNLPTHI